MKTVTADFEKRLKRVRRIAESNADRALTALERMQKRWSDHPVLLVEKARLIQLSDYGSLREAKRSLVRATQVATDSPDPWIELGYFLHAIDDRSADAEVRFDRAAALALRDLAGALAGKIQSILEQLIETDFVPSGRAAELADLLAFAQIIGQREKQDSWPNRELRDAIIDLEEKLKPKRRTERNGKK